MKLDEILKDGLSAMEIELSARTLSSFRSYYELLEEKNKVINLTAISGEEDVSRLHFLDCAALINAAELKGASVIDVGTGAGFPGLPLKIIEPGIRLTLLDSLKKRVEFLSDVCSVLGYDDVVCIHSRAEEVPHGYRENFDYAVSRAVARLNMLCELCLPYLRVGGMFMAMKGPDCEDEIKEAAKAIEVLGGECEGVYLYTIPGTDIRHSIVKIRKIEKTPAKYPRRFAKIQKSPL